MRNFVCIVIFCLFAVSLMAQTNGGIFYNGAEISNSRIIGESTNMMTSMLTRGLVKPKSDFHIEGKHSMTQIDEARPTFEVVFNVRDERYGEVFTDEDNFEKMFLIRLKDSKNGRKLENGVAAIFSSKGSPSEKYIIPLSVEEVGSGTFRVVPREELKKGEYAFWFNVQIPDEDAADGEKPLNTVFDFSIVDAVSKDSKSTPVQVAQVETSTKSQATTAASVKVSDVDLDIPLGGSDVNESTFAVIIANGQYQKVAHVEHAENDGRVFEEYCSKTLGIPDTHIRSYYNVTYGDLLDAVEDIKSIATAKRGDLNIIFYYAGHGIPNEETKTGYLLPIDADGKQMRVCYPLKELYAELGSLQANNAVVFLDACFSGAARSSGDMLIPARGVAIVTKDNIDGKLVVFSAASGSQTAMGYDEQGHGLFTYFLLKKLKDTKGSVDLGSLADYIQENVSLESQLKNRKQQTPTVMAGSAYGDAWKKLTLNK